MRQSTPVQEVRNATIFGRDAELTMLRAELARLSDHGTGLLLIEGEPGIGKTALMQQLLASLEGQRWRSLASTADDFAKHLPYTVLDQLAARALHGSGRPVVEQVAALRSKLAITAEERMSSIFAAAASLLRLLREPSPGVVGIDAPPGSDEDPTS